MGSIPSSSSPSIPQTSNIVSPYGADIDTTVAGTVYYTTSSTSSQISTVSSFIRGTTGNYFYGTRMVVAHWYNVAKIYGSSVSALYSTVLNLSVDTIYFSVCASLLPL